MTGLPCSGKSTRVQEIKTYFRGLNKNVKVISEEELIADQDMSKSDYCFGKCIHTHADTLYIICVLI